MVDAPEKLKARVVSWDVGFHPPTEKEWIARVSREVADAAVTGIDVLVFPELFAAGLVPYAANRVIALQVVPAVRIWAMRSSSQPAVRPLTRRLACFDPSFAIRFIASRRNSARFSAALSNRARH